MTPDEAFLTSGLDFSRSLGAVLFLTKAIVSLWGNKEGDQECHTHCA